MAVANWNRDFTLTSALGDLDIPASMLLADQCSAGVNIRTNTLSVPAGDGLIFDQRFKDGYQMHLVLQLIDSGAVLFDADVQAFYDELMGHLDSLIDVATPGRIQWAVDGGGNDRMLVNIQTLEIPGPSGALPKQFAFSVECPFPYAIDAPETDTALVDGVPVTITRPGSSKTFWAVVEVDGPTSAFTLRNNTLGLQVEYDSTLPGAVAVASGHTAEIDMFRKTVVKDGDVAFLEEGVVWLGADFWPLAKGDNEIQLDGAGGTLKWQAAWA